jgi:hypothetical protein
MLTIPPPAALDNLAPAPRSGANRQSGRNAGALFGAGFEKLGATLNNNAYFTQDWVAVSIISAIQVELKSERCRSAKLGRGAKTRPDNGGRWSGAGDRQSQARVAGVRLARARAPSPRQGASRHRARNFKSSQGFMIGDSHEVSACTAAAPPRDIHPAIRARSHMGARQWPEGVTGAPSPPVRRRRDKSQSPRIISSAAEFLAEAVVAEEGRVGGWLAGKGG